MAEKRQQMQALQALLCERMQTVVTKIQNLDVKHMPLLKWFEHVLTLPLSQFLLTLDTFEQMVATRHPEPAQQVIITGGSFARFSSMCACHVRSILYTPCFHHVEHLYVHIRMCICAMQVSTV